MASALTILNTTNELAYLAGIFNWQMGNASYTTPSGQSTVSFHIITNLQAPVQQYLSGAINTYNLINGTNPTDPNEGLFNTQIIAGNIKETISRKYAVNRVPFANYDQLVDMGTGTQRLVFHVIFAGTMYKTAYQNFIQCIFGTESGVGTLMHPFYNEIQNVLPIDINTIYNFDSLNCVICDVTFMTSDLSHLIPNTILQGSGQDINTWYIGTQNAITSITATINVLRSLSTNVGALF